MAGRTDSKTALLIIDWQRFFVDPASCAFAKGSLAAAPRIGKAARVFLAKGLPVIASIHHGEDCRKDPFFRFYGRTISKRDLLCGLGEPVAGIAAVTVYEKRNYSLFENQEFLHDIKNARVTGFFLCGLLAEKCVLANAFAAFDKGFEVSVLSDCVAARNEKLLPAALSIIAKSCGNLILSRDLEDYL